MYDLQIILCISNCFPYFEHMFQCLVMCLDAKMRFDDNAEFRQHKVFGFRDWSQENPNEVEAAKYNLNYIALDGKKKSLDEGHYFSV